MYSAVLMLALTASSETADFGRNRCHGGSSYGCSGAVVSGCSGVDSCSGRGHRHRLFGNRGNGCSSSYGCSSSVVVAAPTCSSSHGCSNSCSRQRHRLFGNRGHRCSSSHGCSSGYGCTGSYGCTNGTVIVPAQKEMPRDGEQVPPPKKEKVSLSVPATIVVRLPADANLVVDGNRTTSGSARRTLVTPNLEVGATYVYNMRAEVVRDGRTLVQTQAVTVRGGQTSAVQFQFSTQDVASR